MIALIDGDIIAYRCSASCQKQGITVEPLDVALMRVDDLMNRILHETGSSDYIVYISGSDNYRYSFYPEYKANRKDVPKPEWLQQCREHLVTQWNAVITDGIEADDAMGITSYKYCEAQEKNVICTIDKDLLMIPGYHYNFVTGVSQWVSPKQGLSTFCKQLITGDKTDNIFGYDGKARPIVPKFLIPVMEQIDEAPTLHDKLTIVREMYNDDARLLMNARCLWIQTKEDEIWDFPDESKERWAMDGSPLSFICDEWTEGGIEALASEVPNTE